MNKLDTLMLHISARLAEPGTWQGIAFVLTLCGSKYGASLDWGQCAVLGGMASAVIKIFLPDGKTTVIVSPALPAATEPAASGIVVPSLLSENQMNAVSILTLISELLDTFHNIFPNASNLAKADAVTAIVTPTLSATGTITGTVDPTVTAIGAALPVVVASVQAVKLSTQQPAPAAPLPSAPQSPSPVTDSAPVATEAGA